MLGWSVSTRQIKCVKYEETKMEFYERWFASSVE